MNIFWSCSIILCAALIFGCSGTQETNAQTEPEPPAQAARVAAVATGINQVGKEAQEWKTDLDQHSVPLKEFKALLLRDQIPPIDQPKFWNSEESASVYFASSP